MKVGIYSIHTPYNYGAMFQAYATQKALQKMGYEAELVNLYPIEEERRNESRILSISLKALIIYLYARLNPNVRIKFRRFKAFHSEMHLSSRYYSIEDIYKSPPLYDIHLVGSDQVWNLELGIPTHAFYFLDFLSSNAIKISYASSFGTSKIDEQYYPRLKHLLSDFKAISVREDEGVNIISKATGIKATQVMDPTFLLSHQEWASLTTDEPIIKGDYIFCYGFDNSEMSREMINSIHERLKLPLVVISVSLHYPLKADIFVQNAGPKEFINILRNANFICTSSYHGIAFAIHFRKSFFATIHPTRNSRMKCMLDKIGLTNRQLIDPRSILKMTDIELFIDYGQFEKEIETRVNESFNWLAKILESYGK